jgi:glutaredoxin 3
MGDLPLDLDPMLPVTIYTTLLCPYCQMAKQLLERKNVPFSEIDVTGKSDVREAMRRKAGGRNSVPQIWIGSQHVGGYDDLHALDRQGRLDALLHA